MRLLDVRENGSGATCSFAMKNMFDVTHTGINMAKIHPPAIIFILLLGLAALGAFLVGYNSAK